MQQVRHGTCRERGLPELKVDLHPAVLIFGVLARCGDHHVGTLGHLRTVPGSPVRLGHCLDIQRVVDLLRGEAGFFGGQVTRQIRLHVSLVEDLPRMRLQRRGCDAFQPSGEGGRRVDVITQHPEPQVAGMLEGLQEAVAVLLFELLHGHREAIRLDLQGSHGPRDMHRQHLEVRVRVMVRLPPPWGLGSLSWALG